MQCPNCGYDNDEFVRFCADCGAELGNKVWEYADFGVEGVKPTDDTNSTEVSEAQDSIEDAEELETEEDVEGTSVIDIEEELGDTKVIREDGDGIEVPRSEDVIKETEHTRIISGSLLGLEKELDISKYEEERKLDAEKKAAKARRKKILREEAIRKRQKERKQIIILKGMVIVLIIALFGAASYFLIGQFASNWSLKASSQESLGIVKLTPSATPTPSVTATPTATPVPSAGNNSITASVVTATSVEMSGYSLIEIDRISATSEAVRSGGDYSSGMAIDGDETTAWQAGADGNGEGEALFIVFTDEYEVRYINFKLGDWESEEAYEASGRPHEINIVIGEERFTMEFPDIQTQYCLMLSEDVTASTLYISIESVYEGTGGEAVCVSEIEIYGW